MGKFFFVSSLLALSLTLSGCTVEQQIAPPTAEPTPTVDASLIPSQPPTDVIEVDPNKFLTSYGDLIFKVGNGPTWCTVSEYDDFVICEHAEFDAKYKPLTPPENCDYSYGYQLRLRGKPVAGSKMAEFTCPNAAWSDASMAPILQSGERITAFGFNCYVEGQTSRCENSSGDFIVLGPEAWALSD
jgi:hypothetical protein